MATLAPTLPTLRARLRALRARVLRGPIAAAADGLGRGPAHVQLRLDAAPWGQAAAGGRDLEAWQAELAAVVAWRGATPVSIVAAPAQAGDDHAALLLGLARFARRLDCPTTLRLNGEGLTDALADAILDIDVLQIIVELSPDASEAATQAGARLAAAKRRRGADTRITVALRWVEGAPRSARRFAEAARAAGLPRLRLAPAPFASGAPSAAAWRDLADEGLAEPLGADEERWVEGMFAADDGEPGAPAAAGGCPVGHLRLELRADGSAWACPFKAPLRAAGQPTPLAEAWLGGAAQRDAVRACGRRCAHADLVAPRL